MDAQPLVLTKGPALRALTSASSRMNVPYPAAKTANPTEQEEEMQWAVERFHIRPGVGA